MHSLDRVSRLALLAALCVPGNAFAQQPAGPPPAPTMASARLALSEGRVADAVRMADTLVRESPRSREAAALQVETRLAADAPARAFTAYDRYVSVVGPHDALLLNPLAVYQLRSAVANTEDPRLMCAALERLAAAGDKAGLEQLRQISAKNPQSPAGGYADAALARLGDRAAAARLSSLEWVSTVRDQEAVVEFLTDLPGTAATGELRSLLQAPSPQTRSQAATAVAKRGDKDSVAALREMLTDDWPEVRSWAALALKQLGDSAGDETLSRMRKSPVAEVRVEALVADRSLPDTARRTELKAALNDPNPEIRLKAARALAASDPAAARRTFVSLATGASSTLRAEAAAALEGMPPVDVALSRRLLSDGSDWVRVYGAGAALRAAAVK